MEKKEEEAEKRKGREKCRSIYAQLKLLNYKSFLPS
jgi:hypothetical protein